MASTVNTGQGEEPAGGNKNTFCYAMLCLYRMLDKRDLKIILNLMRGPRFTISNTIFFSILPLSPCQTVSYCWIMTQQPVSMRTVTYYTKSNISVAINLSLLYEIAQIVKIIVK